MSVVTNAILILPDMVDNALERVNTFFQDGIGFVDCDDEKLPRGWYGGTKALEATVCIGAFNHLDLDGLRAHLAAIDWEDYGEQVQLFTRTEEEPRFTAWSPAFC